MGVTDLAGYVVGGGLDSDLVGALDTKACVHFVNIHPLVHLVFPTISQYRMFSGRLPHQETLGREVLNAYCHNKGPKHQCQACPLSKHSTARKDFTNN